MNTETLEKAYSELISSAEAAAAAAEASPAAGWSLDQLLAHVIGTNGLIGATTAAVIAGKPATFYNDAVINVANLDVAAQAAGSRDALLAQLRQTSAAVVELARTIDEATAGVLVPTKIQDGSVVRVDQPLPLAALYQAHAGVHLGMHRGDIEALLSAVRS